jgi:hypothetical protein
MRRKAASASQSMTDFLGMCGGVEGAAEGAPARAAATPVRAVATAIIASCQEGAPAAAAAAASWGYTTEYSRNTDLAAASREWPGSPGAVVRSDGVGPPPRTATQIRTAAGEGLEGGRSHEVPCFVLGDDGIPLWGSHPGGGGFGGERGSAVSQVEGAPVRAAATPVRAVATAIIASCQEGAPAAAAAAAGRGFSPFPLALSKEPIRVGDKVLARHKVGGQYSATVAAIIRLDQEWQGLVSVPCIVPSSCSFASIKARI